MCNVKYTSDGGIVSAELLPSQPLKYISSTCASNDMSHRGLIFFERRDENLFILNFCLVFMVCIALVRIQV